MSRSRKTYVGVSLSDGRDAVAVFGEVTQGSRAYFDRSFGNYLPGDPAEAEYLWLEDEEGNVIEYEPTKSELDTWADCAIEQAAEDEISARADADDFAYECERDRRMGL